MQHLPTIINNSYVRNIPPRYVVRIAELNGFIISEATIRNEYNLLTNTYPLRLGGLK